MASELKVNKISPESGTTLTLGDSGDTINFGSGVLPNFENLTVTGDLTVDTNSLKVDSTNNFVGIGTASPSVALDVVGAITATGNITGTLATAAQPNITSLGTLTGLTTTGDINLGDSDKINFGASNDLQIYHDGSNSYVSDEGTGNLIIAGSTQTAIRGTTAGDNIAVFNNAADVKLYYNGASKLATTSTGIDVTGTIDASFMNLDGVETPTISLTDLSTSKNLIIRADNGGGEIKTSTTANDDLRFGTNNLQRLRIEHNGDIAFYEDTGTTAKFFWDASAEALGIGTTSPGGELHLYRNSASPARLLLQNTEDISYIYSDAGTLIFDTDGGHKFRNEAGSSTYMTIDSSGNVGIGTTSPSTELEVFDSSNSRILISTSDTSTGASQIYFGDTDSDLIGRIYYDHAGNSMRFHTNGTEAMRLTSSGYVGIGTSSPTSNLYIQSSSNAVDAIHVRGAGGNNFIHCTGNQGNTAFTVSEIGGADPCVVKLYNTGVETIILTTNPTESTVFNERGDNVDFRIESDTNTHAFFVDASTNRVGILNSSPTQALDVTGTVKATAFQGDGSGLTGVGGGAGSIEAWVNFNGTGTVSIRDSGNVSSITDYGTGYYGVNFTTSLSDTNYAPITWTLNNNNDNYPRVLHGRPDQFNKSTSGCRFLRATGNAGAVQDGDNNSVVIVA